MFRIVTSFCLALSFAAIASPELEKEVEALKAELVVIKEDQTAIARHVGLGALVRPEQVEIASGFRTGDNDAEYVLMEFTDLHCPVCAKFHEEVYPQVKKELIDTKKLLFVSREFPLTNIHPNAPYAAVLLRCAAQQDKYDIAKTTLYKARSEFDREFVDNFATLLKLEEKKFKACMESDEVHQTLAMSIGYANLLGLSATPTFILGKKQGDVVVDYKVFSGLMTLDVIKGIIATK